MGRKYLKNKNFLLKSVNFWYFLREVCMRFIF